MAYVWRKTKSEESVTKANIGGSQKRILHITKIHKNADIYSMSCDLLELVCEDCNQKRIYIYFDRPKMWRSMEKGETALKKRIKYATSKGTCKQMKKSPLGGVQKTNSEEALRDDVEDRQDMNVQFVGFNIVANE